MSAHQPSQAFRNRRLLSGTTALLVVWSLSGAVHGQDLPTGGTGTVGAPTIPVPAPADTNMTVTLNATDTVIDWAAFNIGAGNEVHFDNGGTVTNMSVLNRVAVGGGQSVIDGTLSSDKNIAVWLLNPNGVMFGNGSTVNTGSFFVSTLNMANSDFTSATYRLRDGIDSAGAADATWVANGEIGFGGTVTAGDLTNPGSVGAAGQIITANGAMTATGGDIALIAARDVTFSFTPGSPLGIDVAAGTTLATAKVTVGATGQLEANSIILAGAANITDTLLGVDSGATLEAVDVGGRIILSVGADAISGSHASLNFTPSGTTSAADIVSAGALTAGGDVIVTAPGDVSQTGNVTADGDYRVSGAAITLGGTQGAKGTVVIDGTTLSGSGTLTSNSDGTGTEALELKATGTINMTTALNGGAARQSDVDIDAVNQDVTLGNISAKALTGLGVQDGDIALGTVSVTNNLTLRSMDGSLSVAGVTTDDGGAGSSNASLRADTTVSVNGPVSVDGDYTVTADTGAVTIGGTQGAKGRVEITGVGITGSGSVTSDSDGTGVLDDLVLSSTGTINMTTALNGGSARQSDVDISAANQDVMLGNVSAKALTGLNALDGDISLGTVSVTDGLTIRSTSGSVSVAGIATDDGGVGSSNASVRADTTLSVNGTVSVDGDYTLTSDSSTVTVGGTQGAKGAVTITGVGVFGSGSLTSNSDATGTEALTLNSTGTVNMTTALNGGTASQSDVAVSAAGQNVTLGNVTALNLTGLTAQAGNIALGTVAVKGDLNLRSTSGSLSATAITADDGVSGGAVSDATVRAATNLAVSGNVSVEGDYAATADAGRVTLGGTQGAGGKVTVQGATATFNALALTANKNDALTTGDAAGALSVTAAGGITLTGSGTTLKGGTTTGHFTDVSVDGAASGTGNVTIAGNAVELSAITTTGNIEITAVDSIAGVTATAPDLKATGADTSVKAAAGTTLTVGDVEAGDGTGATPPSPQVDLDAKSITAGAVNARDGAADLHASDGDVTATSVAAKGNATVQADAATVLAANIRIDSVTTTDGDVALTANTGDITGELSTARLSATAGGESSTVTISAQTGKANLGTIAAGTGTAAAAVTDQIGVTAEEIDVTSATANDGDVMLTTQVATGTSITVGSADGGRHVDIDAKTTATAGNLTSGSGDVTVAAVSTATVTGNVTAGADSGATGNYNVTGSAIQLGANAATRLQQARGLVRIHATGDIDGLGTLALTADSNNSGQEPLLLESDSGTINFASTSNLRGGTGRHSKVGIFMGDATKDLTLGGVQARGLYKLAGTGGAEAFLTNLNHSGSVTLGDTSLRNTLSITSSGTISALSKIVVSGTGQGLFLDGAAITANGDLAAQGNVDLNANTITATNIYSNRNIETSGNSLDADLVQALGDVTDTTLLGSVTAITAGTAAPAPYMADVDADTGAGGGPVTDCCDATPAAPGAVAGAGDIILTKQAVDVGTLDAARDLTVTATVGTVTIATSGTAGRDATVTAETSADIGTLEATSRNLSVTAGDTVSVTNGGIDLTAATAGQDVTLSARNGDIKVSTVTADRHVQIENTDRGGTTGDIEIATAVRASDNNSVDGNATVKSADDIRLAEVSAERGNVAITAAGDITGNATTGTPASIDDYGRGDVSSGVSGDATTRDKTILVESTGGRIKLAAITAGDGPATASTGVTQITVTAQGVDLISVTARDGGVELTANDAGNDLSAGAVTAADDIDLESVRSILTNTVSSTAGDIRVTADTGDISGMGGGATAAAMTASGESQSITVSAVNGTARLGDLTAGSGSVSATVTPDQIKVMAKTINFGTAKAWAKDGGLTLSATAGDVTLGTGEARSEASITASDDVQLDGLTTHEGDAVVQATGGDVTGQAATHANIAAGNDVQVTSGGLSQLDTLSAGRNIEIVATGSAEVVGDVTAGSSVSGGGYDVRGQSVTLGKATSGAVNQKATGLVRVAASGGNVTGRGDLTLTSDSDGSAPHGAPVLLEAVNGAVVFGTGTTVQGGPDRTGRVGIKVGAGQAVTLGTVNARAIDGLSGAVGSETFTAGLNTTADISFGTVFVRNGLSLTTTAGNITTGGITVSGANQGAKLTASGATRDITVSGDLSAQGDVVLNAGRDIALADTRSHAGNVELASGRAITGDDLGAAGKVALTATGSVTFTSLASGVTGPATPDASDPGAGAAAGAAGTLALPTGSAAATPAGDAAPLATNSHISVDANAITLGSAVAAKNLTLASRTDVRVDTATATGGAVSITADAGDVSGRTIAPAGDSRLLDGFGRTQITARGHGQTITVTATTGNIQTGTVTAGDGLGAAVADQVTLTAGKAIDANVAGGVDAKDGNVRLLAKDGSITVPTVKARKAAKLTTQKIAASSTDLAADSVTTTDGHIELSSAGMIGGTGAGRMDVTAGGAGSTVVVTASGNALLGDVAAGSGTLSPALTGDGVTITAADIDAETVLAKDGGVTLTATGSDVTATSITGSTYAEISAQDAVTADLVQADSQHIDVEAITGDITIATGDAGTGVTLLAGGNVRTDSLTAAGGNISVTAASGDVSGLARSPAANDGRLLTGFEHTDMTASGDIGVQGADVQLGTADAGAALTVTASKGAEVTDALSVGAATIEAGQTATVAAVESAGADVNVKGAAANIKTATAKTTLTVEATGGDLELTTGMADGAATLTASGNADVTLLTAGGAASVTAGQTATLASIESTGSDVSVKGGITNVTTANAGGNLAVEATAGNTTLDTGTSVGTGEVKATGDATILTSLIAGGAASLDAGGVAKAARIDSTGAGVAVTGASVDVTQTAAKSTLTIEATGGDIDLGTGTADGAATLTASGNADVASLTSGGAASVTAGQTATVASVESIGSNVSVTGGTVKITTAKANKALAVQATAGDATLGTGTAGETADVKASADATILTSLIAGGTASLNAGGVAKAARIDSTGAGVTIKGASADITQTAANTTLAIETTGGDLKLGTGSAGTTATVAASGNADVISLVSGNAANVLAGQTAMVASIESTGSDASVKGASVDVTGAKAGGKLAVEATAGSATLGSGTAGGAADVKASGDATVTTALTAGDAASLGAGGVAKAARIDSTGANVAIKGASVDVTHTAAKTTLVAEATGGNLKLGTGQAVTTATLTASGNTDVTTLSAGGNVGVTAGQTATLGSAESTGGDLTVKGQAVAVTVAKAGGRLAMEATAGNAALGSGDVAGTSDVKSSGNTTIQVYLRGGGTATVTAGGAAQVAEVRSTGGDVLVTGASIATTTANAGGVLKLSASSGGVTLGTGTAAGAATLETTGTNGDVAVTGGLTARGVTVKSAGNAQLAATTSTGDVNVTAANAIQTQGISAAGQAVTLDASDADIAGDVTARTITVAARRTLRLGSNASGTGGFDLSETEVNRLKASGAGSMVALDAGTQDVAIGDLNWTLADPGTTAAIFTTARVDLTGRLVTDRAGTASGTTAARTVILGGAATDATATASVIRIASTAAAGGRIDVGGALLELRGGAIAAGQADDFLDDLGVNAGGTPLDADMVAANYVNQPSSTLYRSRLPYTDPLLVRAGSIKLKYKSFALFQNTGQGPANAGTKIGTSAVPGTIEIDPVAPPNAFAMFGEINEVIGSASALLGQNVIKIGAGASIQNTRINGCVVGAATACLSSSLVQPPLAVFDNSTMTILTAAAPDLSFDSVLSSNNEALFSDIAAPASALSDDANCDPAVSACPAASEKGTQ
ncbi:MULTISPECIES: filamentous hemagglutinin N-terminal domain-containing protein [Asticcacaulis]|uniref:two-partner secretion domain-containing protein n=1 Tax=Asticcacaulis TaxID=76890 RepID=UPI001AE6DAF8|nr:MULTISPECIES: filamentous hemagglutinin N-terminal domain-containing protein [Asticcacaulis]MBP2161052.1 filamentous hemagglutinin family protein [Asticcacaulis solisilvae]MDR6802097.1 filamentous hemagglutinin family protein [Asticcacaulis sp. BE141]